MVGPKPPPIGGSPLTVQAMLREFSRYPGLQVTLINTSPGVDVRTNMTGFRAEKVRRTMAIVPAFLSGIARVDAVLVFSNDLFSITLMPILRFIAWIFGKPFFLKPVAASLDLFIAHLNPVLRWYLLAVLKSCGALLPQTKVLARELANLGCGNVHYLPGCRATLPVAKPIDFSEDPFRLIYLGHITRRKGILVLLEALNLLETRSNLRIICDFYGPVHEEICEDFFKKLSRTGFAGYRGEVDPGESSRVIALYHALVLPTYFDTEGHPGVIIEAMHAGIPVISTSIRTLPELIADGENGYLVPPQNASSLADAIWKLASDRDLARRMGALNRERGQEFTSEAVTASLLGILFPGTPLLPNPHPEAPA